jgi:predicted nuclease with TOPRIM domain
MATVDEIRSKIDNLQQRHEKVLKRKAELSGELKAKKDELANLVKEIKAAGFNPSTIAEDRARAQKELEDLMVEFEKNLVDAESTLSQYDKK